MLQFPLLNSVCVCVCSMFCGRFPVAKSTKQLYEHKLRKGRDDSVLHHYSWHWKQPTPSNSINYVSPPKCNCWMQSKSLIFGVEFILFFLFKIANGLSTLPGRLIVPMLLLRLCFPPIEFNISIKVWVIKFVDVSCSSIFFLCIDYWFALICSELLMVI